MTALDGGLTELLPAVLLDGADQHIFRCDLRSARIEVERKVVARSKSSARRQNLVQKKSLNEKLTRTSRTFLQQITRSFIE